ADAYVLFRRLEHRIQWSTGLQTHSLPTRQDDLARLARSLGYASYEDLERELSEARAAVSARFASLLPKGALLGEEEGRWSEILRRLDEGDSSLLADAIQRAFGPAATAELVRDLIQLARRPEDLLGGLTRERSPELAPTFFD